ncbi:MAG TPA: glycosyltransferase family 2 protein [Candidatus Saccharimonadales bacterium]|nr:glycosyltransferase family 2 protein [Candidatus Saccharimonadales bacterium]
MTCAAVIPCFNEERAIGPLVLAVRQQLALVVVVDDGSNDQTALNAKNAGALVLCHKHNSGKGAALQTGLSHLLNFGFEWAVTLDGDGQHDPSDLPAFLQCAGQNRTLLVIGNRMPNARAMPRLRRRVNRWMSRKLSELARRPLPDTQCGFRLIHLRTWASLCLTARHFEVESEMLMAFLAARHPVEFVPVRVVAAARTSRIRPLADSLRWWRWWRNIKQISLSSSSSKQIADAKDSPLSHALAQKI